MNYFNLEEISVTPNNRHGWDAFRQFTPLYMYKIEWLLGCCPMFKQPWVQTTILKSHNTLLFAVQHYNITTLHNNILYITHNYFVLLLHWLLHCYTATVLHYILSQQSDRSTQFNQFLSFKMSDNKTTVVFTDDSECTEHTPSLTHKSNSSTKMCIVCNTNEALYQPISCECAYTYCKKCAMKCATGGKCKQCSALYGSLRLSHPHDNMEEN
jgi:hypothetical protein